MRCRVVEVEEGSLGKVDEVVSLGGLFRRGVRWVGGGRRRLGVGERLQRL